MKRTTLTVIGLVVVAMLFLPSPISCDEHSDNSKEEETDISLLQHKLKKTQSELSDMKSKQVHEHDQIGKQLNLFKDVLIYAAADKLPAFSCPDDTWTQHDNTYCFKVFHHLKYNWTDARDFCNRQQASLAYVLDHVTNAVVKGLLPEKRNYWLGLNDIKAEGEMKWDVLNSDPMPIHSWDYTNWVGGQPNDYRNNQDCTYMEPSGRWDDFYCRSKMGFICQTHDRLEQFRRP